MANSILTINMITREAVELWKNTNAFIQNIDKQYDDQFAKHGAKIGTSLRIRLPNDFTVTTGPALSVQNTAEQSTTLVLATQKHVDVAFSTQERTMSLDDYSERVLAPMVNNLAGAVAADVISGTEAGVCNIVYNADGANVVLNPNSGTYLQAGAVLDLNSAPTGGRKVVNDPITESRIVNSLSGLFNPQADISRQYKTGMMYQALKFDWMSDQTVIKHTTGTFSAGGALSSGGQTGLSITVSAITGTLAVGDIVTIDGVNAVNRITKVSTGQLRQFVVTAPVINGGTTISIYPAIIGAIGGNQVQYQTVDVSPINGAQVRLVLNASSVTRKNVAYAPQAITMATADLEMPERGVVEAARDTFDGISMRMLSSYIPGTDQIVTRLDVLYGFLFIRPEWACVVADAI